ncbi:N-terminal double-transmembrane domain-containing protein [Roseovarius azorensis]|uniref:N-terminal double-transmembrane domain-containing protein n=1 Tax=Roseovarius azorensis TaxID=1287727 RepID=A0A1H7JDL7_9RHOB|nr:DUF4159 domain-containing protein [Roseovarius azorensis]SEK72731.1 N-terminal double-transmembrane domain-containing protein [Roseovarius azorensis]
MILGPIGFAAPWLLLALVALPILWIILRAVPPAPIRRRFPGVALLLGLKDEDSVTDRTPWWLLLLRMLAMAAVIVGLAGPVLNPRDEGEARATGPLLIVTDNSWASARDWAAQIAVLDGLLAEAGRAGRPVALMQLNAPAAPVFRAAESWRNQLPGLTPAPWAATPEAMERTAGLLGEDGFETRWLSDGLAHPGRAALLAALEAQGPVTVHESPRPVLALRPAVLDGGQITLRALRARADGMREITVQAHGLDPAGVPRVLASLPLRFDEGATEASGALSLPPELRARLTRFEIAGEATAGAVTLTDDGLKRREVALIAGREDREGLELLSPLHYLEQALIPTADLLDGALTDVLPANPDVIVLADVATLSGAEQTALLDWTEAGGMLLRFAGPRVAASDVSRSEEAPLMPVRLRAGGRTVGGAMSWGEPKALAPFPEGSPFQGLAIPDDVTVSAQVMAQPDPTLAERVIAQLTDGTPLVTRKRIGAGQVVLFHVTANAEWSSLPLSGLFVQMLERLAVASAITPPDTAELADTIWQPVEVLDGFGRLRDAGTMPGVPGERLLDAALGPDLLPGLYDGPERRVARNVIAPDATLAPMEWPARVPVEGLERQPETPLGGWLLAAALLLLSADILASLALSGRLWPARAAAGLLLALSLGAPEQAMAQDDLRAIEATSEVVLAHVITGDAALDDAARAGLRGLGRVLSFRTSVEPAEPISVDLETDELAFYPILYWPVTPDQPTPSAEAYVRLNDYLRNGGLILFDTRDADVAGFGAASPNGARLQRLAAPLDIPPLEPVPEDHVLTRAFYLLSDFPGRYMGRAVWVEAAPADAEQIEGMPFRNLNDGVTPVVIGGNDWAAAWAVNERGDALFPVGRGYAGERQRELAYRFGVNLVMHVLTGNYKSDQVHVPALLDRLGQ